MINIIIKGRQTGGFHGGNPRNKLGFNGGSDSDNMYQGRGYEHQGGQR